MSPIEILVCSIIIATGLALGISGCQPSHRDMSQLKTLSQECINVCPRGVKSFTANYGDYTCECAP